MNKRMRYAPEVRERAVRLVFDPRGKHGSQWETIQSTASKVGHIWFAPFCKSRIFMIMKDKLQPYIRPLSEGFIFGP